MKTVATVRSCHIALRVGEHMTITWTGIIEHIALQLILLKEIFIFVLLLFVSPFTLIAGYRSVELNPCYCCVSENK